MATRTAEDRLRTIQAVLMLAYAVAVLWFMLIPAHSRRLMRMRALTAAQRMAGSGGRLPGLASVRPELTTGRESYRLPFPLPLLRQLGRRRRERARGAGAGAFPP